MRGILTRAVRGILLLVVFFVLTHAYAEEWVSFDGRTAMDAKPQLTGILSVPEGNGPFPAVVMLCGCGGLKDKNDSKQQRAWAERLRGWGYVSLRLDSFGPRGYGNICNDLYAVSPMAVAHDAYAAKSYLAGLEFVDPRNIAVIGWSHGGAAVISIIDGLFRDKDEKPFQVAIAFYPWCGSVQILDTPVLILVGEKDDTCPAAQCETLKNSKEVKDSKTEFKLIIYPGAYHSFDFEGLKGDFYGHHAEYNPEAAAEAIRQTRDFLRLHVRSNS